MRVERVKADRLRSGDLLGLPDGHSYVQVDRVQYGVRYVRLTLVTDCRSNPASFSVPNSCRFSRVFVDATINMRPDLVGAE